MVVQLTQFHKHQVKSRCQKIKMIDSYFQVQPRNFDPTEIVQVIINHIINAATCEQRKCASASDKMYVVWKDLFRWIVIDSEEPSRVIPKCSLSVKFQMKNAFATTGLPIFRNTSFLSNCELSDDNAQTITSALSTGNYLKECGVNFSKCVSLATDGASVMMGKIGGVRVQVQS